MTSINPAPNLLAQRMARQAMSAQNTTLEKLATGLRINRGKDDPAGLISSENLRAVLAQLDAETRVMQRADHVAATAEGALSEVSELLVDAEGLAVAAANTGAMSDAEREALQMEMDSILQTVDRISSTTSFNGDKLLDGSAFLDVGGERLDLPSTAARDLGAVDVSGTGYDLADLAVGGPLNLVDGNVGGAASSIRSASRAVATLRGEIGAYQRNHLEPQMRSKAVAFENVAAAESVIRDTDYAAATSRLAREQVLGASALDAVSSTAMQAHNVLSLLG